MSGEKLAIFRTAWGPLQLAAGLGTGREALRWPWSDPTSRKAVFDPKRRWSAGVCLRRLENYNASLEDHNRALKIKPDYAKLTISEAGPIAGSAITR